MFFHRIVTVAITDGPLANGQDMGKVEAGKFEIDREAFLVRDALSDSSLFSLPARAKGVEFIEDFQHFYDGPLLGDRIRLRQVLANLLSNAVKFTKTGSVTFRVEQESETDERSILLFTVTDSGVGIQNSVIPSLFTPFQSVDLDFSFTSFSICGGMSRLTSFPLNLFIAKLTRLLHESLADRVWVLSSAKRYQSLLLVD